MWWQRFARPRCKAIDQFKKQYPYVPIVKWEYVSQDDADLVRIFTDKETLTVQYEPVRKQSMIVAMTE